MSLHPMPSHILFNEVEAAKWPSTIRRIASLRAEQAGSRAVFDITGCQVKSLGGLGAVQIGHLIWLLLTAAHVPDPGQDPDPWGR